MALCQHATAAKISRSHRLLPAGHCGIATFTADLASAILENKPAIDCSIVAMNDRAEGYEYPDEVKFQISQDNLSEYRLAANFLNLRDPDAVCLQHEFGIFGGQRGSFIIELTRNLKVPLVTTFHTVLKDPQPEELKITTQLCEQSDRLVVMSERGADFLREIYRVPASKIVLTTFGSAMRMGGSNHEIKHFRMRADYLWQGINHEFDTLARREQAECQNHCFVRCGELALARIRIQKRHIGNSMVDENYLARWSLIGITKKVSAALTHHYHAVGQFT